MKHTIEDRSKECKKALHAKKREREKMTTRAKSSADVVVADLLQQSAPVFGVDFPFTCQGLVVFFFFVSGGRGEHALKTTLLRTLRRFSGMPVRGENAKEGAKLDEGPL